MSIESNLAIALVLHCYALGLAKKSRATFSTLTCSHAFSPRLAPVTYMYLLRVLIGSLDCLPVLIGQSDYFGFGFTHSFENRSNTNYVSEK